MANKSLTQERLKELVQYDPETGIFINLSMPSRKRGIGSILGREDYDGCIMISVIEKSYPAHRLAWLYMTGSMPNGYIDHINHIKGDNRFVNLRDVSPKENSRNKALRPTNTSGYHGISLDKLSDIWKVTIGVNGYVIDLGSFKNKNDAIIARKMAEYEHGFHPNHGG